MTHNNQDIDDYHSGDDLKIEVTVEENGSPKDITNSSAEYELYEDYPDNNQTIFTKDTTAGGGITIVDAVNGRLDVEISGSDTDSLEGEYSHRLRVTDASGNTVTVFTGELVVNE